MIFPSDDERERDESRPEPKATHVPRQITFWSMHTTASLVLNYHSLTEEVRYRRKRIMQGDLPQFTVDGLSREIRHKVDDLTAIVAELRTRGHSVDWEE